jgi:hypothetical protein
MIPPDPLYNASLPSYHDDPQQGSSSVAAGAKTSSDNNYSFPSGVTPRNQGHIVTSTKLTSSKLIHLKSELFNILYSFPEKALKWPELDISMESQITSAGESAFNNVMSASSSILAVAQENGQVLDIGRMAEKASRKARRRLRRKLAIDQFTKSVQSASSPQDLLTQIILLENAIPPALTFIVNKAALPSVAATSAEVAVRLFVLDRAISYNSIIAIENAAMVCIFKLRVCFSQRCHISGNCTRFLGHGGKCSLGASSFSRLPDHLQIAPPSENYYPQPTAPVYQPSDYIRRQQQTQQTALSQYKSQQRIVEEYLPKLSSYLGKEGIDIEAINPWIPIASEITSSQWI